MWRLILLTFACLGSGFYVLSGGAEYVPAENSLQVRAQTHGLTLFTWPAPAPTSTRIRVADAKPDTRDTPNDAAVSRAGVSLSDLSLATKAQPGTIRLQLASADNGQVPLPKPTAAAVTPDIDTSADDAMAIVRDVATAAPMADIRKVTGARVNMRSGPGTKFGRIARLSAGTPVAVLRDPGDGWLKIRVVDTGRVGWMADWLVTASAN